MTLLSAGCFVDTAPVITGGETVDPATSTGTSDPSTSGPPTSDTTSVDASTGPSPDPTEPSTDPTDAPPACGVAGAACDEGTPCCGCLVCEAGACAAAAGACGQCQACALDGACGPADAGTDCDPPDDPCSGRVYGLVDDACLTYAPADGACDGAGACLAVDCVAAGAPLFECPFCLRGDHACTPGAEVAALALADVCVTEGTTPACGPSCADDGQGATASEASCDADGQCVLVDDPVACGSYVCQGNACGFDCNDNTACAPGHVCIDGACF